MNWVDVLGFLSFFLSALAMGISTLSIGLVLALRWSTHTTQFVPTETNNFLKEALRPRPESESEFEAAPDSDPELDSALAQLFNPISVQKDPDKLL